MQSTFFTILMSLLFFNTNGQNSFVGYRYGIVDYSALNKTIEEAGFGQFDNDIMQFSFGSSKRTKKTSIGVEFYYGLNKKNELDGGNISKLSASGILVNTRTALNKSKKSIISIVFNFGYQRSNLLFYNKNTVKDLGSILGNTNVVVKSFKKNELVGQLGLGYDYVSESGFGFGLDAGYQAGYGEWKYLNLVNPEFPKSPFGHLYAGLKLYFGKKKKKLPEILPSDEPTGPMTFVQ